MQCNLQPSASVFSAPCQRSKKLQLRSKNCALVQVSIWRDSGREGERERGRPFCSGDAANRNGVFSHDLVLEQIVLRVLGLYPLTENKILKSFQKYTRNDQP